MQLIAPRPELAGAADRFEAYMGERRNRVRAFAHKAARFAWQFPATGCFAIACPGAAEPRRIR